MEILCKKVIYRNENKQIRYSIELVINAQQISSKMKLFSMRGNLYDGEFDFATKSLTQMKKLFVAKWKRSTPLLVAVLWYCGIRDIGGIAVFVILAVLRYS